MGKELVISETFALCGWDVSFEELKWIAEWQYVNGVNLLCPHLEAYSLRGLRKRDYPPSLFYQQSWWNEWRLFNDYFARLGALLTSGKSVTPILLIHPIKSAWIAYNGTNSPELQQLDADFLRISEILSDLHLDYHYGDETLLREFGRVENGRFIVGRCEYQMVILPSMLTIDESTVNLLEEFAVNGGKIIRFGDFPGLCQGMLSQKTALLKEKTYGFNNIEEFQILADAMDLRTISISQNAKEIEAIHYRQRDLGDRQCFFLVNHDQKQSFNATIRFPNQWTVRRFNPETAALEEIEFHYSENNTVMELQFLPMQSHVLLLEQASSPYTQLIIPNIRRLLPGNQWNIEQMDLNSYTLDYCCYQVNQEEWKGPVPVIKLMELLLRRKEDCQVALRFSFEANLDLQCNRELWLVLETAAEFEISVNGHLIQYQDWGWWKDRSFQKVPIKPYVQPGRNEIILKRFFYQNPHVYEILFGENVLETEKNKLTFDVELESIYLVGDFGVYSQSEYIAGDRNSCFTLGPFELRNQPLMVQSGNLTPQGFCFFAGSITLSQVIQLGPIGDERIILDLGKPYAVVSKLFCNQQLVKALPWAPFQVDISDFVHEGPNQISLCLFAGNRNLLGPHHHIDGEVYFVGPSSFTEKSGWAEGKIGKPIWREGYNFVVFGVKNGSRDDIP